MRFRDLVTSNMTTVTRASVTASRYERRKFASEMIRNKNVCVEFDSQKEARGWSLGVMWVACAARSLNLEV